MAIQPPMPDTNAEAGPSTPTFTRAPAYKLAQSLSGHRRSVTALKWTSEGRTLISGGADGYLNFWSTSPPSSSLSHDRTLRAHRTGINDLSISPDDLYIATASDDTNIHIFPLSSSISPSFSNPSPTNPADPDPISSLARPLRVLSGHTAPVLALAFSPKSNLIVSGSFDESAIVWDVRNGLALRQLPAHSEAVWTVGWDSAGAMVLTGSADGLIRLWDASTGQCLKTLDNDSNSPITSCLFTPHPYYLISGTPGTVRVYNIHTGRVVKTLRIPEKTMTGSGQAGVNGSNGNGVTEGKEEGGGVGVIVAITPALKKAGDMELDQDQNKGKMRNGEAWAMSTTDAGNIVIWELSSRRVVQVLEGHKSAAVALAVQPGGRCVVSGSVEPEKIIHVWRDDE